MLSWRIQFTQFFAVREESFFHGTARRRRVSAPVKIARLVFAEGVNLEKSRLRYFLKTPYRRLHGAGRFGSRSEAVTVAVGFSPRGRREESSVAERRFTWAWRVRSSVAPRRGHWVDADRGLKPTATIAGVATRLQTCLLKASRSKFLPCGDGAPIP